MFGEVNLCIILAVANLVELVRSVNAFEKVGKKSDFPREFTWVLRKIAQEDLSQMEGMHRKTRNLRLVRPFVYIQRMIEIGYIFSEIFVRGEYKSWQPNTNSPKVIDLGGDPGIYSVLYWKHRAPDARVTIVEANPATVNVMRENSMRRRLKNVQIINAAVMGDLNGSASLHLHGPRSGWHTQDYIELRSAQVTPDEYFVDIPKVKLSDLITEEEKIDLLKVDIEGSEGYVMRELAKSGKLKQVEEIVMEFHHDPTSYPANSLIEMLDILQTGGFDLLGAHITLGNGMRSKREISTLRVKDIALLNKKVFLTLWATRGKNKAI